MRNVSPQYLPHHLLRIQFWIVRREKQEREPRVPFQALLYHFRMVKPDIVENHNDGSSGITFANHGKECLKCFRVSRISDVSCQGAVSEINYSK